MLATTFPQKHFEAAFSSLLRSRGVSYEVIAETFKEEGYRISVSTVRNRIKANFAPVSYAQLMEWSTELDTAIELGYIPKSKQQRNTMTHEELDAQDAALDKEEQRLEGLRNLLMELEELKNINQILRQEIEQLRLNKE